MCEGSTQIFRISLEDSEQTCSKMAVINCRRSQLAGRSPGLGGGHPIEGHRIGMWRRASDGERRGWRTLLRDKKTDRNTSPGRETHLNSRNGPAEGSLLACVHPRPHSQSPSP